MSAHEVFTATGYRSGMQKADQYRQFAETLMIAAEGASPPTYDLMLDLAKAWNKLADEADDAALRLANVVNFPGARVQQRSARSVEA
jgi:hypothetical protein